MAVKHQLTKVIEKQIPTFHFCIVYKVAHSTRCFIPIKRSLPWAWRLPWA